MALFPTCWTNSCDWLTEDHCHYEQLRKESQGSITVTFFTNNKLNHLRYFSLFGITDVESTKVRYGESSHLPVYPQNQLPKSEVQSKSPKWVAETQLSLSSRPEAGIRLDPVTEPRNSNVGLLAP